MNAFPERRGVEKSSSARATPSDSRSLSFSFSSSGQDSGSGTGNSKQPTVKRGSCRMSLSSWDSGSKSDKRIWTIGGGSTGRRSRSPAPQARAATGCWRTCRWYLDWIDWRRGCGGGGGGFGVDSGFGSGSGSGSWLRILSKPWGMLWVGRVCRGGSGGIVDGPWLPTKEIGLFSEKIGLVRVVELLLWLNILGRQRNSFFGVFKLI